MAENDNINLDDTLATGDVYISEEQTDIEVIETVDVIEVEESESYDIDALDAFPALGEDNESLRHALLNGREIADQHPITAITGLREELNEIKSLKTVYSDKINQADYYLWEDENILQEDRVGYFVSAHSDVHEIKICTSDNDIFGVTVDVAGFVGAQSDVKRDIKYGLVVTNGIVRVRCELSVNVGDYVISNDYGYAQKNDSGYRVVGRHKVDGIEYAEITLVTPISRFCELSSAVRALDERVDDAETNIVAAINVANEAHNKASEAIVISDEAIKNALESLDKSNAAVGKTDELESIISSSNEAAVQAKAIAESAVVSAESIKNEAVADANKALAETSELRKELEATIDKIDTDLENTSLELEATKESLANTKTELQGSIDDAVNDIESLEKDLEPLATWPEGSENPTGIAGFVARADEDSATLASMVTWQGETNESIASFKQEVAENYATQEMVTDVGNNLALFKQEVKDDYATQEMVTEVDNALTAYKQEVEKNYATQQMLSTVEGNLASYKQEVTDTYATQQMVTTVSNNLASYKQEVTETYATQGMVSEVNNSLTSFKQEVANDYATQDMVTKVETDTSKALTDYKQEVSGTYATQKSLTDLETDTTKAIAASEEKATETYASKSDLTSFESDTKTTMARIEQKADANGAYIQSTVSNMDKYSVGPYSQAYGFTLEQARAVLEEGMVYVPTPHKDKDTHDEIYTYTEIDADGKEVVKNYPDDDGYQFTPGYIYTWSDIDDSEDTKTMMWTESVGKVVSFGTAPSGDAYDFWYTNSDTVSDGYEPYTLYKLEEYKNEAGEILTQWVAVATFAGNSSNRAVSQIRQDTNSVNIEVANARGSAATLNARIGATEAAVQSTAQWAKGATTDGEELYNIAIIKQNASDDGSSLALVVADTKGNKVLQGASVVLGQDEEDSYISLDADNIHLEGYTTVNESFSIDKNGYMNASGGTIGGWKIGTTTLTSKDSDTSYGKVGMSSNTSHPAFWAGSDTNGGPTQTPELDSTKFYVTHNGYLHATEGNIGGCRIVNNELKINAANITEGTIDKARITELKVGNKFSVSTSGILKASDADISGKLKVENGGTIGDFIIMNGRITNSGGTYPSTTISPSGFSFDNGNEEIMVGRDINKSSKLFSVNSHVIQNFVFKIMENEESQREILLSTSGSNYIKIYDDIEGVIILQAGDAGYLEGTWYNDSGSAITSDINKKNSIINIGDKYDTFFDNLVGRTFKYNDGTSGRLHTGFVAQEVKTALDGAGVDTSEFGGLVIKQNADNTEDWYLRYGEFIALNTWQIQKLKARVAELERKIEELGE